MISFLFDLEMLLSITGATLGIGGFLFTLKYRNFYSVYARSSILLGGISALLHTYNFDFIRVILEPSQYALTCVLIQMMFSLSVLAYTYTILRFKWKWQVDVREHCESQSCPLKDQSNCPFD